ncbi:hypothetical protein AVEN_158106-1 [Araneus ventricosus]|uniref:Secreted protein n=1 Tax=Araneus ventricosus TaxID=182803 RepID=A0A4Y2GRS5_ARAVE|nr:hypothetical protein AVEN_158106-1 [Araneus ventricosus]
MWGRMFIRSCCGLLMGVLEFRKIGAHQLPGWCAVIHRQSRQRVNEQGIGFIRASVSSGTEGEVIDSWRRKIQSSIPSLLFIFHYLREGSFPPPHLAQARTADGARTDTDESEKGFLK